MLILGVDPGTATTGYGLVKTGEDGLRLISFGWIQTKKDGSVEKRLKEIYENIYSILQEFKPDIFAIERLFFYSNAKTAISVGQAQGVLILAAASFGIPVFEYPPAEVKFIVSGNGRADKILMKRAVKKIFNLRTPNKKKTHFDDVADAIAVALCHAFKIKKTARKGGD